MNVDILPLAVAILIALPAAASCIGIGLSASRLLEATARQPAIATELQTRFFLSAGLLDGALIIATGIGLWFATASPFKP